MPEKTASVADLTAKKERAPLMRRVQYSLIWLVTAIWTRASFLRLLFHRPRDGTDRRPMLLPAASLHLFHPSTLCTDYRSATGNRLVLPQQHSPFRLAEPAPLRAVPEHCRYAS